ncbi:MAG: PD-(D/E)XK nuclease family protein [Gemmatimonadales bacterium]|nr:MAG: PD-(D/E)XK nuclease family protein [Gemmatimonadales bacterium]
MNPSPHIRRHFMGWDEPALVLAVRHLVRSAGGAGRAGTGPPEAPSSVLDLSGFVVVLPGGRAGRRLEELLVEEADARGLPLRPPRILTVGALPEHLAPPERPAPSPGALRVRWARALSELPGDALRRLLQVPPGPDDLAGWMELAGLVVKLRRRVGAGGHSFQHVAELCGEGLLFDDRARWEALARAEREVMGGLEAHGYEDRDDARRRALVDPSRRRPPPEAGGDGDGAAGGGAPEAAPAGAIVLVAVPEMPAVTLRLVELAAEGGTPVDALVHAPDSLAHAFDALGLVDPEAWSALHAGLPEDRVVLVDDPRGQARAVVDALHTHAAGRRPEEITVGVPDTEVTPYLEDELARRQVRTRRAEGRPLSRTSPVTLLAALARVLESPSHEALAALVRHPALERLPPLVLEPPAEGEGRGGTGTGSVAGPRPPASILDSFHEKHLQETLSLEGLEGSQKAGDSRRRADMISLLRWLETHLLGALRGEKRLSAWREGTYEVLRTVWAGSLDARREGDRAVVEVAERVRAVFDGLAELPPSLDARVSGAQALRIVLGELAGEQLPPRPDDDAVELLGWLELHLDDAPVLVITGVNEGAVPEAITGDPFLPHALVRRLGLLDNRTRRARDLHQLRAMSACREGLVVVAGRRTASGDPLRPSRLLLAEPGEVMVTRLLRFLEGEGDGDGEGEGDGGGETWTGHEADARGGEGRPGDLAGEALDVPPEAEGADPFQVPPETVIQVDHSDLRMRVTDFRGLLSDPWLWALRRVRGLEAVDDEARELDPGGFGTLLHAVLEAVGGRPDEIHAGSVDALRAHLDAELARQVRKRFEPAPHPAVRLQVEQARARLHHFAEAQVAWTAAGWRVRAVEVGPTGGRDSTGPDRGVAFAAGSVTARLVGRIDRIDHNPATGQWALLDYKSSKDAKTPDKVHRKKEGRGKDAETRWVDLQLPLYRHLLEAVVTEGGERLVPPDAEIRMGFVNLPADGEDAGFRLADWSPAELEAADQVARALVLEAASGYFELDPERLPRLYSGDPLNRVLGTALVDSGESMVDPDGEMDE